MIKRKKHIKQKHDLSILPKRVGRPYKFRAWNSVIVLSAITLLILIPSLFFKVNSLKVEAAMVTPLQKQLTTTQQAKQKAEKQTEKYKEQLLKNANLITADPQTVKIVDYYIDKYFGSAAPTARKIFVCESHLNPDAIHVNNSGLGEDIGIAQLNTNAQSQRFQKVTGVDLLTYGHDIGLNIEVAHNLYQEQGFKPWVCAQILGIVK